ncbi:MAG: SurA N-terminal domain-containing protein [candidate division FCPU426 bacterium]
MMNLMRKYTKIVLWIVVAAFVATIFFVWGMDLGKRQQSLELASAAMVNGEPISYEEFGRYWEQQYRQLFGQTDEEPSPQEVRRLREDLVDNLIDSLLLRQLAKRLKLSVLDEEVASRIYNQPAFQQNGKFSQEKYLQLLNYSRISPAEFEQEQAQGILIAKVNQALRDMLVVTDEDVRAYYQSRMRKLKLQVVEFPWQRYLPRVEIPETQIEEYYQYHRAEFDQPEEVAASHILVRTSANATEEEKLTAKLKLENLRNEIVKGKDFAEMAREHSDDPGSASKGGDLGYFKRGAMVKPFEEAAFKLKAGELSAPVETPFGYHLIKVTGRKEAKPSTLAGVRSQIVERLKNAEAKRQAQRAAAEFHLLLKDVRDLSKAAAQSGLAVTSTDWLRAGDALPKVADSKTIVDQAFDLPLNQPGQPMFAGENVVFVQGVAEQIQPWDETKYLAERDALREKLKSLRGNQAIHDWLANARKTAKITNNIIKEKDEEQQPGAEAAPAAEPAKQ